MGRNKKKKTTNRGGYEGGQDVAGVCVAEAAAPTDGQEVVKNAFGGDGDAPPSGSVIDIIGAEGEGRSRRRKRRGRKKKRKRRRCGTTTVWDGDERGEKEWTERTAAAPTIGGIGPSGRRCREAIRSNWFGSIRWIRRRGNNVSCTAQAPAAAADQDEGGSGTSATNKAAIESLRVRLNRVKRELGPATARAAAAAAASSHRDESSSLSHVGNGDDDNDDLAASSSSRISFDPSSSASTAIDARHRRRAFEQARRACNPFEALGEGRHNGLNRAFVNRSAVKLANLDAVLGFCLTKKRCVFDASHVPDGGGDGDGGSSSMTSEHGGGVESDRQSSSSSTFRFVDLCGAPGGFSEYIMYRRRKCFSSPCHGYGMSLLGSNDDGNGATWRLDHMRRLDHMLTQSAGADGTRYRVSSGADGTGDVYVWDNVVALRAQIAADSSHEGNNENGGGLVDLVVADGGFDAQRDSECQEALAVKIVTCQAAAALSLLMAGGTFVLKAFGFQLAPTRFVMMHLFHSFDAVAIIKPVISRPASAERYVICRGYDGPPATWDGLAWRDHVLQLGKESGRQSHCSTTSAFHLSTAMPQSEKQKEEFESYMDAADCDIHNLNIETCSDMLSFLERKACGWRKSDGADESMETHSINVESYREAWMIE